VRAVEKTNTHARFDGERDRRRAPSSWICIPYEPHQACHSGTVEDAQFWDGPPLQSEFVAQVLGQAMPADTPNASAAAAYGKPAFRLVPRLDRNF